jgi:hypothetical protein
LNPWLPPCERVGGERHANLHLRSSRRTVRGEVRRREVGGLLGGPLAAPDHWPHPYHESVAKRRANPRCRRSLDTVSTAVMGPLLATRAVSWQASTIALPVERSDQTARSGLPIQNVRQSVWLWGTAAGALRTPAQGSSRSFGPYCCGRLSFAYAVDFTSGGANS